MAEAILSNNNFVILEIQVIMHHFFYLLQRILKELWDRWATQMSTLPPDYYYPFLDPSEGFGWIFGVDELYKWTHQPKTSFPMDSYFKCLPCTFLIFFVYLDFYILDLCTTHWSLPPPKKWTPHPTMEPSHPSYYPTFVFDIFSTNLEHNMPLFLASP